MSRRGMGAVCALSSFVLELFLGAREGKGGGKGYRLEGAGLTFLVGGADEVLDTLLDQEGLEVDPVDRLEADIPLHKAVRFVNGLAEGEWEGGAGVVELLLDAGADPRSVMPFNYFPPLLLLLFSLLLPRDLRAWGLERSVGEWRLVRQEQGKDRGSVV